jgi:uncharacterized protein
MKNAIVIAFLLIAQAAFCQIPEPGLNTYVNDFAHVLTPDQISALNAQIAGIEKNTGTQLAIVLVSEIPAAYEIEDYALLIGRKWHVGNNKNGIVYVAAINQHKQRLQIATGLYQTLTKDRREAILDQVKPYFKKEDYTGGLSLLITQVGDALDADFGPAPNPTATSTSTANNGQPVSGDDDTYFYVGVGFVIVIALVIAYFVRRRARMRRMQMYNSMGGGFGNGPGYPNQGGPGVGTFIAGAAAGAVAGYAAERLIDGLDNNNAAGNQNPSANNNQPQQNDPPDYGNWGGGSSFDDSSSSDDSGFSSDSSDSDSGSSSDW